MKLEVILMMGGGFILSAAHDVGSVMSWSAFEQVGPAI